jgi:hypothetical protein
MNNLMYENESPKRENDRELPKRKIQVEINISADDFLSLREQFEVLYLHKITLENYMCSSFSGGVDSSHLYTCVITSEQTAENYQRELAEYIRDK